MLTGKVEAGFWKCGPVSSVNTLPMYQTSVVVLSDGSQSSLIRH